MKYMEHGLQQTALQMLHCCYGKQEVHQLVHKEMTNKQTISLHFGGDYGEY